MWVAARWRKACGSTLFLMPARVTHLCMVLGIVLVTIRRFHCERKTGCGPSGFLSQCCSYCLAYSSRASRAFCPSADRSHDSAERERVMPERFLRYVTRRGQPLSASSNMSTKAVDKPVGKLISYPVLQAVQSMREADCLNRPHQQCNQISKIQSC